MCAWWWWRSVTGMSYMATLVCPRCGRRTIRKRDGIFSWRACPAAKSCGWTVFVHGQDPRDEAAA